MITFTDGPASKAASGLCIRRAPRFLRVVYDRRKHQWDCLDQLHDTPTADETIYAYRLTENRGVCCIRRARSGGGCFQMATYAFIDPQPDDSDMRTNDHWQKWAHEQADKEEAAKKEVPQ